MRLTELHHPIGQAQLDSQSADLSDRSMTRWTSAFDEPSSCGECLVVLLVYFLQQFSRFSALWHPSFADKTNSIWLPFRDRQFLLVSRFGDRRRELRPWYVGWVKSARDADPPPAIRSPRVGQHDLSAACFALRRMQRPLNLYAAEGSASEPSGCSSPAGISVSGSMPPESLPSNS